MGFVHLDGLAVKARSVSFGDRPLGILILRKSHESESPGASGLAVVMTLASVISPWTPNASRSLSSVVSELSPPTQIIS